MARPTVNDIVKAAGVSLATVDRVLNGRPGVRPATIMRVQAAIEELGYVRDVGAANLARQKRYRMVFVLPRSRSAFNRTLHEEIEAAAKGAALDRMEVEIVDVPPRDPHALAAVLGRIDSADTDGVAIVADETPHVRDAIARLKAMDVAVVALSTDLPNTGRDHFAGIDSKAAGRTAGVLLGRFLGSAEGSIAVLANSMVSHEAIERRRGFDEVINGRFAHLTVLPTIEVHDDHTLAERLLETLLAARDDIVGLYAIGGGNRGIVRVLRKRQGQRRIVAIAHDLTPAVSEALRDGVLDAVISQNVGHMVRSALRVLRAKRDRLPIVTAQEQVRIEVVLRENMPTTNGAG